MSNQSVSRDGRSTVVENASYRIAYLVMSFGLLAITAYRGFILYQSSWDLLTLLILGGVTATLYQGINKVLSRRWIMVTVAALIIAGLLAGTLAATLVVIFR